MFLQTEECKKTCKEKAIKLELHYTCRQISVDGWDIFSWYYILILQKVFSYRAFCAIVLS